jgi:SUZ domain
MAEQGHVTLLRTSYARIPPQRLSELSKSASDLPEVRQIMRRVRAEKSVEDEEKSEGGSSRAGSVVQTREERKQVYERARARIFADYVAGGKPLEEGGEEEKVGEGTGYPTYAAAATFNPRGCNYPGYIAWAPGQRDPSRDSTYSRTPSRPESRTSTTQDFHPNPFAREFIPTTAPGTLTPPNGYHPQISPTRNSTPPGSSPRTTFDPSQRSHSATSMRPPMPASMSGYRGVPFPPPTMGGLPPPPVPFDWGPPITEGVVHYMRDGKYRIYPGGVRLTVVSPPVVEVRGAESWKREEQRRREEHVLRTQSQLAQLQIQQGRMWAAGRR